MRRTTFRAGAEPERWEAVSRHSGEITQSAGAGPLGVSIENLIRDFWVIINKVISDPTAFILTSD